MIKTTVLNFNDLIESGYLKPRYKGKTPQQLFDIVGGELRAEITKLWTKRCERIAEGVYPEYADEMYSWDLHKLIKEYLCNEPKSRVKMVEGKKLDIKGLH